MPPLDDANVTRFCSLLDELVKITKTKFVIISHHALTMSRMHRLYGVTMPEKGVSQLVGGRSRKGRRVSGLNRCLTIKTLKLALRLKKKRLKKNVSLEEEKRGSLMGLCLQAWDRTCRSCSGWDDNWVYFRRLV